MAGGTIAPAKASDSDRAPVPTIRARGVELLGEMAGSGYREAPLLVRRGDGQTIQLTPLLYWVLDAMDGTRTNLEIAWEVAARTHKVLSADDVTYLIDEKLRPLGVVEDAGVQRESVDVSGHVEHVKANPLLALRLRFVVTDPRITNKITAPFAQLFRPLVAVPALVAFIAITAWVLAVKGLGSAMHDAIYDPRLLLLVFALTALSAGFHEFGHAAACRYGGASPGAMGVALYLIWPAFYTDVTDSYRLGKAGRLRVDAGGLYFNALFAIATFGAWSATGADALLVMIPIQLLQMLRQLVPLVRFDGYHILADLTGVPDLFARIRPTLRGLLPSHWHDPETKVLKPWARIVVSVWVLVVVPALAFSLVSMVLVLPRLLATTWDSLGLQWRVLQANVSDGDYVRVAVRLLSIAAIALTPLSMVYLLSRVTKRTSTKVWRAVDGQPAAQGLLLAGVVVAAGFMASAWWPDGQYVPVAADERAALIDGFGIRPTGSARAAIDSSDAEERAARAARVARRSRVAGRSAVETALLLPRASLVAPLPDGEVRIDPDTGLLAYPVAANAVAGRAAWPFPFAPPPAPGAGDNFAVAVNTVDGESVSRMSSSLLWLEGGAVDNKNRSYALASCVDCTTSATAFQAIIVSGESSPVVPENTAVAVNYECTTCVTHSVAVQLVVTLDAPPTAEMRSRIGALYSEVRGLQANVASIPPLELHSRLRAIKAEMLSVLRPVSDQIISETDTDGDTPAGDERTVVNGDGTSTSSTTTTTAAGATSETTAPAASPTSAPPDTEPEPTTTTSPPQSTTTTTEPEPTTTTTSPPPEPAPAG